LSEEKDKNMEESPTEESPTEESPRDDNSISFDFIIGQKLGMTTIYSDNGASMPVTVIEAGPCKIVQVKSVDKEGYSALQIGFGISKKSKKPISGHFRNANIKENLKVLKEFRSSNIDDKFLGKEITVNSFNEGDEVSVTGKSKGKGFAGHMKRHNFGGGRASHGKNSVMRKAGSVGAGTWPGRVWPGTRMAGRMGGEKVTVENLKVLRIDKEKNLLFVKGSVPGPSKSILYIQK
jgi:large subunit ribosomal protein L3